MNSPNEPGSEQEISVLLKDRLFYFATNDQVFSPRGLDRGTAAMLSVVNFMPDDLILDLGCGYGPVGILAAACLSPSQVVMCDISSDAVRLSGRNARRNGVSDGLRILRSDGLKEIAEFGFTKILSNPPYHADFSVAKHFIEEGRKHLAPGGVMYMVTKRKEWYKNKLISVFGGVHIDEIDGYYVFSAEKRAKGKKALEKKTAPAKLSKKLARKKKRGC